MYDLSLNTQRPKALSLSAILNQLRDLIGVKAAHTREQLGSWAFKDDFQ